MYGFPWYLTLVSTNHASSNPGQVSFSFHQLAFSRTIFSILFRVANHQIIDKKNETEFAFYAFKSEVKFHTNRRLS